MEANRDLGARRAGKDMIPAIGIETRNVRW